MSEQKGTVQVPPLPPRRSLQQPSTVGKRNDKACDLDTVIPPPSASLIMDNNVFARRLDTQSVVPTQLPSRDPKSFPTSMQTNQSNLQTSSSSSSVSSSSSSSTSSAHRRYSCLPTNASVPLQTNLSLNWNYMHTAASRGYSNNLYSPIFGMLPAFNQSNNVPHLQQYFPQTNSFNNFSNDNSQNGAFRTNRMLPHQNSVDNFTYLLSNAHTNSSKSQNLMISRSESVPQKVNSQKNPSGDLINLDSWEDTLCRQISNGNLTDDVLVLFDPLLEKEKLLKQAEEVEAKEALVVAARQKPLESLKACEIKVEQKLDMTRRKTEDDVHKARKPIEARNKANGDTIFRVRYREIRSNEEMVAFAKKLRALRLEYKYDDILTNTGLVISPTLDSQRDNSLSVKLVIETTLASAPVIFTCNVNTSIQHVVEHTIYSLVDEASSLSADNFILKVSSLEEYLLPSSTLGDYVYVHHCHKFDKDVKLKLIQKSELQRRFARTLRDDEDSLTLSPDDLLPQTFVCRFGEANCDSVNMLLETLGSEIKKLLSSTSQEKYQVHVNSVCQVTKAICSLLGNCETYQVTEAFENLSQHITQYKLELTEAIISEAIRTVHDEVIHNAVKKFIEALERMVYHYCEAFPVDFEVDGFKADEEVEGSVDIEKVQDTLLCYVSTVCGLNFDWETKYREFYILCEVRYGDRLMAECRSQRVTVTQGLFKRLVFNDPLNFDMILISSLPREACLTFSLYGLENQPSDSSPSTLSPTEAGDVLVAVTTFQLFDLEDYLKQGTYILGFWTNETVIRSHKTSIPHSCIDKGCPLLVLDVPGGEKRVRFPNIDPDSKSIPRRELKSLDSASQTEIYHILNRDPIGEMQVDDKRMLWDRKYYLMEVPHALPKVLKSIINWNSETLPQTYAMISKWAPLTAIDAMQLFLPSFPDRFVRHMAVNWLKSLTNDEVIDYLPQLIQALRYDLVLDSPLVWFLLRRCFTSVRVAHKLYWLVKENVEDPVFAYRSRIILNALLSTAGQAVKRVFEDQEKMLDMLSYVSERLKAARDSSRLQVVLEELESVHDLLILKPMPLPISPSMIVSGLDVKSCSYFTSNTLPLKLVFKNSETKSLLSSVEAIYKVGDDLRQDMLTMQMIQIMDKLWLKDGLDLKIVTFNCVATDSRKGFVEMVKSSETLRKIQTEYGVTGSFKDRCIANWLRKYNTYELEYQQAVDNFTSSCAGYAVATYILGVCDRHNDNIMITNSGHLFHIDFGKFLGDSQMLGNIKRDRVPFVLTSDMAYVINGGDKPSRQFQYFIDSCCQAFNIIRRHTNLFLSLFSLMISSGIPGVSLEAVKYVHKALHPSLSEAEAMSEFTRMIEESLRSRFTQFNFFIHNLAQLRFTGDHNDQQLLSFAPKVFTRETDRKILNLEVINFCKKYEPEKQYFFVVKVERDYEPDPSYVLRTYAEFCEFYQKLSSRFPLAKFYSLGRGGSLISRSNTRDAAEKRMQEIRLFLNRLLILAEEISQSDLVYTFFHHLLRDQEWLRDNNFPNISGPLSLENQSWTRDAAARRDSMGIASGQIKLSILYKNAALTVMIMHAKNLQSPRSNTPDCYAKTYLHPDPHKYTKRKTKVVWKNCHPSFMEMILYQMPLEVVKQRTLEVSIWDYDRVQENLFLGSARIPLGEMHLLTEVVSWYPLEL